MDTEYFEYPGMPGRRYFRCDPLRASISVESCAVRWKAANEKDDDACATCRQCSVGAKHAGVGDSNGAVLCGAHICARCHRPASRLIFGQICVSCYNRSRERAIGRNAKGTAPVKLPPLYRRILTYRCGPAVVTSARVSLDLNELIVGAFRDSRKRVEVAFTAPMPDAFRQGRLW